MNIECDNETLAELEHSFKFSDAVLRHLIVQMPKAVTNPSPMMREEKAKSMTERMEGRGDRGERPSEPRPAEAPAAAPAT
jgi:small subunit ribosomal protein S6